MSAFLHEVPVVEVVVEIRWLPSNLDGKDLIVSPTTLLQSGPPAEQVYEEFRLAIEKEGFTSVERLIPVNFPHPAYTPLIRYRNPANNEHPVVIQLGVGILSVHALSPYCGWGKLYETVQAARTAMSKTSSRSTQGRLTNTAVRYINFFDSKQPGQQGSMALLHDLGLTLSLPGALQKIPSVEKKTTVNLQFSSEVEDGRTLTVQFAPRGDEENAFVLDIGTFKALSGSIQDDIVLEGIEGSHSMLKEVFASMVVVKSLQES